VGVVQPEVWSAEAKKSGSGQASPGWMDWLKRR